MSESILAKILRWPYELWLARKRRIAYEAMQENKKILDHTFSVIEKYVVPHRGDFFKPEDNP